MLHTWVNCSGLTGLEETEEGGLDCPVDGVGGA